MTDLEYGPVELVLAEFDGELPDPGVIEAIGALIDAGTVRLLDLVLVARDEDGTVNYLELDDAGIEFGELNLVADGIAGDEDVQELGGRLAPGSSALLLVVELLWVKNLASRLLESGGRVVDAIRIPAPAVSAVVAEAVAEAVAE